MEFIHLVFTRMPAESDRGSSVFVVVFVCDVFRTLINSLVC